ncbi:MAG: MFS transporter [Rhodocyclaceae bacterium]|nr:MAG: MFS transporter [Rhodocyclaceae bacterium]
MREILILAICQGLLLTHGVSMVAVTGLAGRAIAPDPGLATLPLTAYVLGGAAITLPAAFFMHRYGRRAGFSFGALLGCVGALVCAFAVMNRSFVLLILGSALCGGYTAFGQQYRFAAADAASPTWKSRAISLTLAGGILGGVLGPWASTHTRHILEPAYLGTYLSLAGIALVALACVSRLNIPPLTAVERARSGRPISEIARQPAYLIAVLAAATGYGVMNLLMTATPLAMDICGHPYADTALVLEWHVIGMFAPSFFTGDIIKRFGVLKVIFTGTALMAVCISIALNGASVMHFWWALVLLGVGWNFLYIGGTTLLVETYRSEEKAKAQGTNDFIVFVIQGITSFASGILISRQGWETLNTYALPAVAVTAAATLIYGWRTRRKSVADGSSRASS